MNKGTTEWVANSKTVYDVDYLGSRVMEMMTQRVCHGNDDAHMMTHVIRHGNRVSLRIYIIYR